MNFIFKNIPVVGFAVWLPFFLLLLLRNKWLKNGETPKTAAVKSIRIALGLILLLAGNEKLGGLPDIIGPHYLITELEKYNLGLFGTFVAFSQVIIGFVLLTNRLGALGDIMAFPMFLNIWIVTLSLGWQGTPKEVFLFIVMNLILLASDWHKIKFLITDDTSEIRHIGIKRGTPRLDMLYGGILGVMLLSLALHSAGSIWPQRAERLCLLAMIGIFLVINISQKWKNSTK